RAAMNIELRPLIGNVIGLPDRKVELDVDQLLMNGVQIATISRVRGAAIRLMSHVPLLSESEEAAISKAVAAQRGGVPPKFIKAPGNAAWRVIEEAESEGEDTETDDSDE